MIIINKSSRKDLVKKQKACVNEVWRLTKEKGKECSDPKVKEVMHDFSRWTQESKILNDERGRVFKGTYDPEKK